MGLAFDGGLGFIQNQDLQRLGISLNKLWSEFNCLNQNFCNKVMACLSGSTLQTILANVPSYANNTAAITGGLVVGNTYYNTTINTYTRVI